MNVWCKWYLSLLFWQWKAMRERTYQTFGLPSGMTFLFIKPRYTAFSFTQSHDATSFSATYHDNFGDFYGNDGFSPLFIPHSFPMSALRKPPMRPTLDFSCALPPKAFFKHNHSPMYLHAFLQCIHACIYYVFIYVCFMYSYRFLMCSWNFNV